jgi:hypothetical protein
MTEKDLIEQLGIEDYLTVTSILRNKKESQENLNTLIIETYVDIRDKISNKKVKESILPMIEKLEKNMERIDDEKEQISIKLQNISDFVQFIYKKTNKISIKKYKKYGNHCVKSACT